MGLFPLQIQLTDFAKRSQGSDAIYFVVALVVVVILLLIINIIRKYIRDPSLNENTAHAARHLSIFSLRQLARNMGLSGEQIKMLQFIFKLDGVTSPDQTLHTPDRLDSHFKKAYQHFVRTASSKEDLNNKLALLFATRNVIEASSDNVETSSTREIPENTPAILKISKDEYPVRVIFNTGESLVVENPVDDSGSPLQLLAGTTVILSFFAKTSKGFSVESRVLGHSKTPKGPALQLVHSGQIKRLSSRRYRRRQVVIATNFFPVYIEEVGRKKTKKMVVDKHRHTGSILDISVGGCSIKTNAPVNSGSRLKIEFGQSHGSNIAALGQVLRTNKKGMVTIMHVKFLKIPRNSLNLINGLVYKYAN